MNAIMKKDRVFKFFGIEESFISRDLKNLLMNMEKITWEIHENYPETHLKICLEGHDEKSLLVELDRVERDIYKLTGPSLFAVDEQRMEMVVGRLLDEKSLTISVAESCTGGRIGNMLTDVPGSSGYFLGGVIVYGNPAKEELLNVDPDILCKSGAVSEGTAIEMAWNVRNLFHSNIGIATTGIAGPDGGSSAKPVGTVHIGLSSEDGIFSGKYCFKGTRDQIKQGASIMALDWVRRYINGYPFIPGV